jgi:hypothetical protein
MTMKASDGMRVIDILLLRDLIFVVDFFVTR